MPVAPPCTSEETFMKLSAAFSAPLLLVASALPSNAQPQFRPTGAPDADGLTIETVAAGLANPWAIAFLPDGRILVTERAGRMRIVAKDGNLSPPVAGVPPVFARGQGGLHDVILDRDFAKNGIIYFCFAMPVNGGGQTALARARLTDGNPPRLDDVKVTFQQEGPP